MRRHRREARLEPGIIHDASGAADFLRDPVGTLLDPAGCFGINRSGWSVACDSRQAVKVGAVAGDFGQAVGLHRGENQAIVGE